MKRLILAMIAMFALGGVTAQAANTNIEDTVVKMKIADGVSMDDAIASMKLRANLRNMKLVAQLPLSKQIEAMGQKYRVRFRTRPSR